jgi:Tol biopolymer transport system component
MADLDERFRSLSRTRAPDLWADASTRRPRPLRPPPTGRRVVAAVVALALATAAILGTAIVFLGGTPRPAAPVTNGRIAFSGMDGVTWQIYSVEPDGSDLRQLTDLSDLEVAAEPAWSPDGARIAFVVQRFQEDGGTGRSDVWVMDVDGGNAHPITDGPGSSWAPSWSPDGTRIAFMRSAPSEAEQVWIMGADGSEPRAFTRCGPPECIRDSSPAWSPDGETIAFVRESGAGAVVPVSIMLWPADGVGDSRSIPLEGALWAMELDWSPDGLEIAFSRSLEDGKGFGLAVANAHGTGERALTDVTAAQSPAWSPDGREIAFMASVPETGRVALFVMNADGTGVHEIPGLEGDATSPSWQPVHTEPEPTDSPVPSPPKANGSIYFRVGGGDAGSWIDSIMPDGTDRRTVFPIDAGFRYSRISFSPDGSKIAFDDLPNGLVVAGADGSGPSRLSDGVNDSWPSWSPDGSKIVFSSTRHDPSMARCTPGWPNDFRCATDIYVMDADGSNVVRVTDDPAPEFMPVWSPDGDRIAFVRTTGGTAPRIFTMRPDGSDVRQISSGDGGSDYWPSWSPDGSQIVFIGFRYEESGIWIIDEDGSNERQVFGQDWYSVSDPVWSPDGTLIAFVGSPNGGDAALDNELYVVHPDGTGVVQLADAPRYGVAGEIAWQPLPASSTVKPSPSESASVAVRVTTTRVAEFPSAVAFGEGGVWVTSCCTDGTGAGEVTRLDTANGNVVANIPVRAVPGWDFGGAGLTVASGSVWTLGTTQRAEGGCCDGVVSRIDPATNSIIDELVLPGITDGDLWVDGDAVYVLGFAAKGPGLDLAKLSATTHEIAWRAEVPGQWSQTVFVAGGSVWVLGTAPDAHGPVEVTTWYRLDPTTGALLDELRLPQSQYIPAVHEDTVWYRTADGAQLFETTSGELVGGPVQPGPGCCIGPFVADGAGGVWVVSSPGAGIEGSIWHIDESGTVVASGTIEDKDTFDRMAGQSYAFDPQTQTIWVQHYEDSVTRIEIAAQTGR